MIDIPRPPDNDINRPHWEAAAQGKLLVQRCASCGNTRFPAMSACPRCHSAESSWIECGGRGTIESFCIFHKAYWPGLKAAIPYTVLQVALPEGLSIITNLAGMSGHAPRIGATVEAVFEKVADDLVLVRFKELPEEDLAHEN
ncbi:hypothetical protein SM0020_18237 [Sinorhizobium meliloti CCNWSX0020]|uniref:DUF35 domain-containing protein n=1 Tax=Sinorhizobium meliloti CCNWSX0020 TaxID=1107881 RepID=H0G2F7_RHIML|nr:zinc ribbon domain-containing protein [Sinorhizobium meliloti]EHK76514.1 hypothetical protein SM0020_18237 [Sinorhizobium meliloti CCNWSX0020]